MLRYYCCWTLFPSVKRLPAPLRASQLGRERETLRVRTRQGRDTHYTHTHHTPTHATPLPPLPPSFSTVNPPIARPFAAPRSIEPTPTPSPHLPVLSDAAFHCTRHGYLQTPAPPTSILQHSLFTKTSSLSLLGEQSESRPLAMLRTAFAGHQDSRLGGS